MKKEWHVRATQGNSCYGFFVSWTFKEQERGYHKYLLRDAFYRLRKKLPGCRVVKIMEVINNQDDSIKVYTRENDEVSKTQNPEQAIFRSIRGV